MLFHLAILPESSPLTVKTYNALNNLTLFNLICLLPFSTYLVLCHPCHLASITSDKPKSSCLRTLIIHLYGMPLSWRLCGSLSPFLQVIQVTSYKIGLLWPLNISSHHFTFYLPYSIFHSWISICVFVYSVSFFTNWMDISSCCMMMMMRRRMMRMMNWMFNPST